MRWARSAQSLAGFAGASLLVGWAQAATLPSAAGPAATSAAGLHAPGPGDAVAVSNLVAPALAAFGVQGERVAVLVELEGAPLVATQAAELRGRRLDGLSLRDRTSILASGREHLARLEEAQTEVARRLVAAPYRGVVLYRVQRVLDAIAAEVDAASIARVREIAGVRAVHRLPLVELRRHGSVPLIAAPIAWDAVAANVRGEGVRIGVVDTGIDYLHVDLGGPGAGYEANDPAVVGDVAGFPGPRVVGGWDFVGDDYDPNSTKPDRRVPKPDADPMDCEGHGTHVAGIAAGSGVTAAGAEYTGPYTSALEAGAFRIAPGVAPQASVYALKVFGCTGASGAVPAAIDWAVDPNGDGDLSDHLDILNLSVGSPFGHPDDPVSAAADSAAAAGVAVVAAAGNDGDGYYITSAPGTARSALSVAASVDASDVVDGFRIESPAAIAGANPAIAATFYKWSNMTAPVTGQLAYPASQATGCARFDATNSSLLAGKVALLDWSDSCQSGTRVVYANLAGAIGVIIAYDRPELEGSFPGASSIPAVVTTQAVGQTLKANLAAPVTVSLDKQFLASQRLLSLPLIDTVPAFSSRGPAPWTSLVKPDLMAPGVTVFSAARGTGNKGVEYDGTSMAAPHVAGMMALLRQLHPEWPVEELKALAINTATHDLFSGPNQAPPRYGVGRSGAGRIDAGAAIRSAVVARDADDPAAVSVSFGALEVLGSVTWEREIEVLNKGAAALSLTVGYTPITDLPGVDVSLPGGSTVSVAARASARFPVRLVATASQMKLYKEPTTDTAARTSSHWVSEETGYVTLAAASGEPALLRVPLYAAARPASAMGTSESALLPTQPAGTLPLTLTGTSLDPGPFGQVDDFRSALSPFELAFTSPDEPSSQGWENAGDIGWVGVSTDYAFRRGNPQWINETVLQFGVGSHGRWSTPNGVGFGILVDTDRDGTDDYLVTNAALTTQPDEIFVVVCTLPALSCRRGHYVNTAAPWYRETALFNSDVMVLPVTVSTLGLDAAHSSFYYRVIGVVNREVDGTERLHYDFVKPGLDFTGTSQPGPFVLADRDGTSLPVTCDLAAFLANGSSGVLLLHHHNAAGQRAQVIPVVTDADAMVSVSGPPTPAAMGADLTFTATVSNAGPAATAEVVVTGELSGSAELLGAAVSQGSCGSSLPLSCSLGDLAAGAVATVGVTVRPTSMGRIGAQFSVSQAGPDPSIGNNSASADCFVGRPPRRRIVHGS